MYLNKYHVFEFLVNFGTLNRIRHENSCKGLNMFPRNDRWHLLGAMIEWSGIALE